MRFFKVSVIFYTALLIGCQSHLIKDTITSRNENIRLKSSLAHPYGANQVVQQENSQLREYRLMLRLAGIGWDRAIFSWNAVQPDHRQWNWAYTDGILEQSKALGVRVLPVLTKTPNWATVELARRNDTARKPNIVHWRRFVSETVGRYPGINFWQLWETPDNFDTFEGIPNDYVELLKEGYLSAREANPDCVIVMGSISNSNWLDIALGFGAARYCDIIALHLSATVPELVEKHVATPEDSEIKLVQLRPTATGEAEILHSVLEQLDRLLSVLQRHAVNKPVWITSIGDFPAPAEVQARLLTKLYTSTRARGVHGIFWHEFVSSRDGGTASGLLFPDINRRPAAEAHATLTSILGTAGFTRNLSDPESGLAAYEFRGYDSMITVAWSEADDAVLKLPLSYRRVLNHLGQPRLLLDEEKENAEIEIGNEPVIVISEIVPLEAPAPAVAAPRRR